MARGPLALPSQQQKYWEKIRWRQTVMAIREDVYRHKLSLKLVIAKWMAEERLGGELDEETIRRVVFYKTTRWVTEYDLPGGDTGFA